MKIEIYINEKKLTLFSNENISVSKSVSDIKDIGKNTTEFTKAFSVPADDNNNDIFKHYYNADLIGGFDARIKVDSRIEIDGFTFSVGKMRLNKVRIVKGRANDYNINYWGSLVSLKDVFGNDKLADLDFSAQGFAFTGDNVAYLLQTSGTRRDVMFGLFPKRQYFYDSTIGNHTDTPTLVNIAPTGGSNGILYNELSPSIRAVLLIELIEAKYGIVFSRDFFGTEDFDELFLLCNDKLDIERTVGNLLVDFNSSDDPTLDLDTEVFTMETRYVVRNDTYTRYQHIISVSPDAGFENVEYTLFVYNTVNGNKELLQVVTNIGVLTISQDFRANENIAVAFKTYNVTYEMKSDEDFDFTLQVTNNYSKKLSTTITINETYVSNTLTNSVNKNIDFSDAIPDMKVIDFLRGIFQAFKLVVIPEDEVNIYVANIEQYNSAGDILEITQYIDNELVEVSRGTTFSELSFKFQEPETILQNAYEQNENDYYGDEELDLTVGGDVFDGGTLEIELPFETLIFERLPLVNGTTNTTISYGALIDKDLNPKSTKPILHYFQDESVLNNPISFVKENSTIEVISTAINGVTSVRDYTDLLSLSFLFSQEINPYTFIQNQVTLFSKYYAEFVSKVFNEQRRQYKFKANLSSDIIYKLSLNDVLVIQGRQFRIDSFDLNLITGEATLNLYNVL